MLKMDGYNEAIIGEVNRFGSNFILYDYKKVININMQMGMTEEEATEYWSYNQVGAWVGDETPAFLMPPEEEA